MRLIDADALKERFDDYIKANPNISGVFELGKFIIDNAPTVEPPNQLVLRARDDAELELLKTAWGNGEICFTPIVAYTARPQGEWIIVKDEKYGDNVKCPFCGKELAGTDLNFCCKCGADMRGGK